MPYLQEENGTFFVLPAPQTSIMNNGIAIPSDSATLTNTHGGNNSTTSYDGQAVNLLTTMYSNGNSFPDYENGGVSSQGGHERRDTGKRYYCPYCPADHGGFLRDRDIKRHINSVHNRQRRRCNICGKDYGRSDGLNRHKKTHS